MKVHCEKCKAEYNIDEGRIGPEGLQIRCPRCLSTFIVTNEAVGGGEMFEFNSVDQKAIGKDSAAGEDSIELDHGVTKTPQDIPPLPSLPTIPVQSGLDLVTEPLPKTPAPPTTSSLPPLYGSSLPSLPGSAATVEPPSGKEGQIFDFQNRDIAGAEETAPSISSAQRYRIRRKNGKVFGPFDGETINRMLIEHQLIGNEEASSDGSTYKALGGFPEFADSIQKLMDEPIISPPLPRQRTASAESRKEYKDEPHKDDQAQAPVAERKETFARSRTMLLALGGVALVVIAGLGLGLTSYGFFGYRFFSDEVDSDAPGSSQKDQNAAVVTAQTTTASADVHQAPEKNPQPGSKAPEKPSESAAVDAHAAAEQNALGEAHYAQKNFSLAEAAFREAIKNDPELAPAYFNLANTYRELGRYNEAIVNYQKVAALAPKYPNMAREYGYTLYLNKDYAAALKLYLEAIRLNPKDDRLYLQAGIVSLENGDAEKAAKYFQTATDINGANIEALVQLGNVSYKQGNFDQAQEALKRALEIDKDNPDIHYALGQTLLASKQWADALEEFRIVVKLKPDRLDAAQETGKLLIDRGQYEEAVAQLNRALAAAPKQVELLILLGDAYQGQSLLPQALKTYQRALAANPKTTGLTLRLARTYDDLNQKAAATKFYLETIKQEPTNAIPHYYLGYIYKANNNKKLALAEFRRYLQLRPDAPDAADVNDEIAYLQNE